MTRYLVGLMATVTLLAAQPVRAATQMYFHPLAADVAHSPVPGTTATCLRGGSGDHKYISCLASSSTDQGFFIDGGVVPRGLSSYSSGWGWTIKWMQDGEESGEQCWALYHAVIKNGQDVLNITYNWLGSASTSTTIDSGEVTLLRSVTSPTSGLKDATGAPCDANCGGQPLKLVALRLRESGGNCSNSNVSRFAQLEIFGP